ncbi:hypothetical protein [Halopiger xanaduensis]|uniref:Uncharacterized protein n=1 Tax=Halopiger xanaduensis (strain DSM 18323 / JCM 14033 / SH-6) TaxID=797210 RepID=F8D8Q9_HALXS|nr:hypothetical protein [Halopiger xanaduensis]AEH36819.1 hypothetical protein Halxa_2194 [Halopiger xanaduensis SH-6]
MPQCPRRSLLGGLGTTLAVAFAGSTAAVAADESSDDENEDAVPPTFDSVRESLPASVAAEPMTVTLQDLDAQREANDPHRPRTIGYEFGIDPESVSTAARVTSYGDEYAQPIGVLTGDVEFGDEFADEGETRELADVEYDRYDGDDAVAADAGDIVVIAEETETIEAAFEAGAGETDRLFEAESLLEEAFDVVDDADGYTARLPDEEESAIPGAEDAPVEYIVQTTTVLDPDALEVTYGIAFEDEDDVTDELVETLEAELAYMPTKEEPSAEVDGALVTVTAERDLAAEREIREHDSPGSLRIDRDADFDGDTVELEVGRGDPTPIEDLTLELDDEEYDRDIWADGQGKLEEGDTIEIDTDDIEPNLSVTLTHDHELGSSSSTTTVLNHFRFEYDYDVNAETLTVEYADDYPLDGDKLSLAAREEYTYVRPDEDEDIPDPKAETQPWTGETLEDGDTGTLEGVEPGDRVLVGWEGTTHRDAIGRFRARPPGYVDFEYDYDAETVSATLEFPEDSAEGEGEEAENGDGDKDGAEETDDETATERPADEYELRVGGEPAATQWADDHETVSGGETIEIEDVDVGTEIEVVWGEDADVSGTRAVPTVDLEVETDGTVEHAGGDAVPASKLEGRARTDDDSLEISLDEYVDGEFAEGDSFDLDVDAELHTVHLRYDGEHHVGYGYVDR